MTSSTNVYLPFVITVVDNIAIDGTHAKLLNPTNSTLEIEREILTPETKLELVLAAQDDLEKFASDVKQVKALETVVSGAEYEGNNTGKYMDRF